MQEWLLAYAHALQHVGEVAHGRSWHSNGDSYTPPQVSTLVDAFLEEMDVQLIEKDIIDCLDATKGDVPWQCDAGYLAEVVSYLDKLVMGPPTGDTWDVLIFPAPVVREDPGHQSFTG